MDINASPILTNEHAGHPQTPGRPYRPEERPHPNRFKPRLLLIARIARILPPFVANRLRTYMLRTAGLKIGNGSIFWGMPTFLGDNITEHISIGDECGFNVSCIFDVGAPIVIGNHVSFGHHVMVLSRTFNMGPASQRAGAIHEAPVVIEDGAWVGARCLVMPGVTIGAGAVIGATMVIAKDVPANTLLLGPQKISLARWRADGAVPKEED